MLKDNINTTEFLTRSSSLLSSQLLSNYKQTFTKPEKNNHLFTERNSQKIHEFLESFEIQYNSDIRDSGKKPEVNEMKELKIKKINRNINDQNEEVKKCINKIQNYKSEIKVKLKEEKIKNQQLLNKIKKIEQQLQRFYGQKSTWVIREKDYVSHLNLKNNTICLLEAKIKELELLSTKNNSLENSLVDKNKQLMIQNEKSHQENLDLKNKLQKNQEKIKLIIGEYKRMQSQFNSFKEQVLLINNNMNMEFSNFKSQIQSLLIHQDNYKHKLQEQIQLLQQTIKKLQITQQSKKIQEHVIKSHTQEQCKQIMKQIEIKNKQQRSKEISTLNRTIQQKNNEIEKLKHIVKTSKQTILSLSEGTKLQAKREKQIFNEAVEQNKNLRKRIQQLEKLQKSKIIF